MRQTDLSNGGFQDDPGTVTDYDLSVPMGCAVNPQVNVGATCSIASSADALIPGFVTERKRTILSLMSVNVRDAGADGSLTPASGACPPTCGSGDEAVFERQGVSRRSPSPRLNQGWRRMKRPRFFVPLASLMVSVACLPAAARAADRVYWSDPGNELVQFANLDNSPGGGALNTTGAMTSEPTAAAIDAAAGRIYWANDSGNSISFANLDNSGGGNLNTAGATPPNNPEGIAIDPIAGRVYWSNGSGGGKISFARIDNSGGQDVDTTGASLNNAEGVTVDRNSGRVYWSNTSGNTISYANLDGSGGGHDLDTGSATVNNPYGVGVDTASGRVFWANYIGNKISYAMADNSGVGGDFNTGAALVNNPEGIAIDRSANRVYWANQNGVPSGPGGISFANLDGTGGGGNLGLAGATVNSPGHPALLKTPVAAGAPTITGGRPLGSTLNCSRGSWAPDLLEALLYRVPQNFAFQWSRDGKVVAGANASAYAARVPGEYRCAVTASNAAGSAAQTSAARTVSVTDVMRYRINPRTFLAASSGPSALSSKRKRKKAGARVSFVLDSTATVRFKVKQRLPGRKGKRGRCVRRTKSNRNKRKCTRTVTLRGGFKRAGIAGKNSFRFTGRLNRRKLKPGRYLLVATPSAGGRSGLPRNTRFRIKRPHR